MGMNSFGPETTTAAERSGTVSRVVTVSSDAHRAHAADHAADPATALWV
ncbi:hypothetical protein [Rhodococcus spelaei]|nr:hypothetical protein [Rhodococcus spelaei]